MADGNKGSFLGYISHPGFVLRRGDVTRGRRKSNERRRNRGKSFPLPHEPTSYPSELARSGNPGTGVSGKRRGTEEGLIGGSGMRVISGMRWTGRGPDGPLDRGHARPTDYPELVVRMPV